MLREVYTFVRKEESREGVMMGGLNFENPTLTSSASVPWQVGNKNTNKKRDEKHKLLCEYCHKLR